MSISSLLVKGLKKGVWVWNDATDDLTFDSAIKEKKQKKQREALKLTAINGLTYVALKVNLKFKATVSEVELLEFRRYLKVLNQGRVDSIVTIQDCKTVALFLCMQQLPNSFYRFYNLLSINELLRACIVYIQFYLQTCENIVKTQHLLKGNPIAAGKLSTAQIMKEDLEDLRVLIGRSYAGIIFTELNASEMSQTDVILLTEYFFKVSSIVVWIALERKYLGVIKVEFERIFRSGNFNNFSANEPTTILNSIKKENFVILNGKIAEVDKRKNRPPCRLSTISPAVYNFLKTERGNLIMIGKDSKGVSDDRLKFFSKYFFLPETEIQQEGLTIGILGIHRRLFDPLLYPCTKRNLKLLITGSPMDISEDRKRLREIAVKKSLRESEPQSPHIFDELPKIPRLVTEDEKKQVNVTIKTTEKLEEEFIQEDEEEYYLEDEEEEGEEEEEEEEQEEFLEL